MIDLTFHAGVSANAIRLALEGAGFSAAAKRNLQRARTAHRVKWLKNAAWMGASVAVCGAAIALVAILIPAPLFAVAVLVMMVVSLLGVLYCLWEALRPGAVTRGKVRDDPVRVMELFLKSLLGDGDDREQAYVLLAPTVLANVTPEGFEAAWDEVRTDLKSRICDESATCSRCGKSDSDGLWSVRSYDVMLNDIRPEEGYVRCDECFAMFCGRCYRSLGNKERRTCPSCGDEGFVTSRVFHPRPELALPRGRMYYEGVVETDASERVARLCAFVKIEALLQDPYESKPGNEVWISLGERGTAVCYFYNTGVRIGEQWFLVSALPMKGQPGARMPE